MTQLLGASRRADGLHVLIVREREVLGLMAEGRSNGAIAGILAVSERSVEKHVGNRTRIISLGSCAVRA